ncbi:MAG: glycosyltransferase family 2 protein [Planctomycetota bacterium]
MNDDIQALRVEAQHTVTRGPRRLADSDVPAPSPGARPPLRAPGALPSLSVVIPVFNEASTIRTLVHRVLASPCASEVILVDDGSTDGSGAILVELESLARVRVLRHPGNRGKGAAIRTGFGVASCDVVLVQDADLEYDPADFPKLLRPFVEAQAHVVYGSRFLRGEFARGPLLRHYGGNRVLTFLSNLTTGLSLTDMETCYKAVRRDVLQGLRLRSERFTIEPELTAKLARVPGVRIFEVPINYRGRVHAEGKKIGWRDGVSALWAIARYAVAD